MRKVLLIAMAVRHESPLKGLDVFLEWIGKSASDDDQNTYSAGQLAALSKMATDMIREIAQRSLLDERDRCSAFVISRQFCVSLCGLQWKPKDR
jgi:hypothetical protein